MKVPVTDKFLLEVYTFLREKRVAELIFGSYITKANILTGQVNPIIEKYKAQKDIRRFNMLLYRLKKANLIKVKNLKHTKALILTKEGISKALKASFLIEKKIKRKDGKWIMIIFDLPASHKAARSLLKSIIVNAGYKLLQYSVWVSPYDVYEKTEALLQLHSLDKYVKIFLIEQL